MTVTFNLANNDLAGQFLAEALKNGLYALKGHRAVVVFEPLSITQCRWLGQVQAGRFYEGI